MATTPRTNPDFDFFMGLWKCRHRYLVKRLSDCHDWIEFEGSCAARKILDGFGNMDEGDINLPVLVPADGPVRPQYRELEQAVGRSLVNHCGNKQTGLGKGRQSRTAPAQREEHQGVVWPDVRPGEKKHAHGEPAICQGIVPLKG